MKKRITLILTLVLIAAFNINAQNAKGQKETTIHYIQILDYWTELGGNANDGYTMRKAAETISLRMETRLESIKDAMQGNVIIKRYDIYDSDYPQNMNNRKFSRMYLQETLDNLSCSGDIVVVLYHGHGFSTSQNLPVKDNTGRITSYPDLKLTYDDPQPDLSTHYYFGDILCEIQRKNPALMLSFVNACQNELPEELDELFADSYKTYLSDYTKAGLPREEKTNMENPFTAEKVKVNQLFTKELTNNQITSIEFISSSKNEFTYVREEGGHFAEKFLDIFKQELESNENTSWEKLTYKVEEDAKNRIKLYNELASDVGSELHQQTPQCRVFKRSRSCYHTPEAVLYEGASFSAVNTGSSFNFYEYQEYINGTKKPPFWLARNFIKLGDSYINAGGNDEAIRILSAAESVIKTKPNEKYLLASLYENMGLAYFQKQNYEIAKSYFLQARSLYEQTEAKASVSVIDALLGKIPDNK